MAVELGHGVVEAIITYLTANLPAELDAVDAQYNDGITLDDPATYYRAEQGAFASWPFLIVKATRTQILRNTVTFVEAQHDLILIVGVLDMDTDTLQQKLYRYAQAINEVLSDGRRAGSIPQIGVDSGSGGTQIVLDFSPILQEESGEFVADFSITFGAYTVETK